MTSKGLTGFNHPSCNPNPKRRDHANPNTEIGASGDSERPPYTTKRRQSLRPRNRPQEYVGQATINPILFALSASAYLSAESCSRYSARAFA